jgi:hypothetical protein
MRTYPSKSQKVARIVTMAGLVIAALISMSTPAQATSSTYVVASPTLINSVLRIFFPPDPIHRQ